MLQREKSSCNGMNKRGGILCIDQGGGKSGCHIYADISPTLTTTHQGEPVILIEVNDN